MLKTSFFLIIVLLGITFGIPNDYRDEQNVNNAKEDDESRIVRGKKVSQGTYPFICLLQRDYGSYREKFCAGTIIDRRWVVTAAHCTMDFVDDDNYDQLRVLCGTTIANNYNGTGVQYMKIKRIVQHPLWDFDTKHHDIALLEIDGEFHFSHDIFPACLAPTDHVPEDVGFGRIMGWGAVEPQFGRHGNTSWDLLDGNGTAVNYLKCKKSFGWNMLESQICVTHPENHVCAGDSGGPYIQFVDKYKRDCIVAIVSYGFPHCDQMPSVFTKVSAYLPFILESLKKKN